MILVTGGAGFIGSHLVEALLHRRHKVRVLDNLSTGKMENLEEATGFRVPPLEDRPGRNPLIPLGEKAEFLKGDISDEETCRKACESVSCVFHEAALGSVQRSVEDPLTTHRINATGTMNMLWAAKEAGVRRFLYASSSSVFGNLPSNAEEVVPTEESDPLHPESPYAATKLMGELYCRIFSCIYGLETVSLRYFNVFGPRQDPEGPYAAVIPKWIAAMMRNRPIQIYGDGRTSRDFCYIENVVQANLLAARKPGAANQVYNIALDTRTSLNELFTLLRDRLRRYYPQLDRSRPVHGSFRPGDVRHSQADISKARRRLGYVPTHGVAEGLDAALDWYRTHLV
jgi:UDP-N-acetylglucosamine/UDP-N-acetyl-alpha-D-glucosaminouronate 4-epimerase